jgi:hypothetical protein
VEGLYFIGGGEGNEMNWFETVAVFHFSLLLRYSAILSACRNVVFT